MPQLHVLRCSLSQSIHALLRPRTAQALAWLWLALVIAPLWAAAGGSIAGTVTDSTNAVVPLAKLVLVSQAQHTFYRTVSNATGSYSFLNVPVGKYDLDVSAAGFATRKLTSLAVDTDASARVDVVLIVGKVAETVTVSNAVSTQVETTSTHLGEVVSAAQMAALPLNGRSYTDLLSIQPGVAPSSTLLPSSVIMAGVTGSIDPSGDLNPGNLSINGQRESSNGFMVDGIDVQEHMNGGTSIIPDLDSIEQFRVLTANFDPEYGNYNGGMVTVVSKSGSEQVHGTAFEFFRNTSLDARGYFDPTRSAFNQNQLGGAVGGPVRRESVFFFGDYQATRTTQGVSADNITVLSGAERGGDFVDQAAGLSGSVSGPYLATLLTQKLGHAVASGEKYYTAGCTSPAQCVFPNAMIPQTAWSAPARILLQYIPSSNVGTDQFSTSAFSQTVRDDKGSMRVDANTRVGQLSGYYFIDDYRLDNPYPSSVAGASIPGFDALFTGRAQLYSVGDTKVFGSRTVNEFHAGYLRNNNIIGQPKGGLGVSLASQGFVTGPGTSGIVVQAPQFEGVENITFPSFVMGVPITNETQINNTYYVGEGVSRAVASHTLKLGAQFHNDEVNEHPNATFNGTFNIDGSETGSSFADFLIGTPSNYTQSSGQPFYLRNRYLGAYAQDSWRARNDLTINAGLRWDLILPWWEKYNQLQTYIPGAQSTLYPGAPPGLVVAGDPGVPRTLAPPSYKSFAPRIALAYSPQFDNGLWKTIFGGNGRSSIRASYGLFYTAFPGLTAGIMYAVPPFGYNYLSPGPPLLQEPFITAASGVDNGQRFPFPFPSNRVSASRPDTSVDWSNFVPLSADPFFDHRNRVPYLNTYMLSLQRQISRDALLTVSYVGNQGHRILTLVPANPGKPALCLELQGCGPFGEDTAYTNNQGKTVQGTRVGQGPNYGENTSDSTIASSNYNALESTLRYQHGGSQFLLSYTYAKSIDQGSNLGEQLNSIHPRQSRAISAWDLKHSFVATYALALPVNVLMRRTNRITEGWSISGTTRFASGFPVTLFDNSDNSLLGTLGNGANNYLLDTPRHLPGPLRLNRDGRKNKPAFDTSLFPEELLGELGNAKRRSFYGPGIENSDAALQKKLRLTETKSLEFRAEGFNLFNHAQFYGPASVDGQEEDAHFGDIDGAAPPRLMQLAAKLAF